ncbi:hypothetical protein ABFU82_18845 [Nocardioides sp. WV_118_6]
MKPPLVLSLLTCALLPLVAACANPSHASEADSLRERLADLPGVASADLDYTEPITLDSGKLALTVALEPEAEASAVVEVVATTYAAFAGTHHAEEGDLDISWRDDVVHLRSFEPEADLDDVRAAAQRAVPVLERESTRVDLETQDVDAAPHVRTLMTVTTAPGVDALLAALPGLEKRYGDLPQTDWTVQADPEGSWTLHSSGGLPGTDQLTLFHRLRAGLPQGASIWLGDDDWASVALPAGTSPDATAAVAERHLGILGGPGTASYDVQVGDELALSIIDGECSFGTGPIGALLDGVYADGCRTVAPSA